MVKSRNDTGEQRVVEQKGRGGGPSDSILYIATPNNQAYLTSVYWATLLISSILILDDCRTRTHVYWWVNRAGCDSAAERLPKRLRASGTCKIYHLDAELLCYQ